MVEHGIPRNGALREPVFPGVNVDELSTPGVTHHLPGSSLLHAPYSRRLSHREAEATVSAGPHSILMRSS